MSHLDEGTLQAMLDGEIPAAELAPVTRHLAECAECRDRRDALRALMGEADALIEALDHGAPERGSAMRDPRSPTPSRMPIVRPLAWAASVLFAAGLGYWAGTPGAPSGAGGGQDAEIALTQLPSTPGDPAANSAEAARAAASAAPSPPPAAESRASAERPTATRPTSPAADAQADLAAKTIVLGDSALIVRRAETILPDTGGPPARRAAVPSLSDRERQENRLAAGAAPLREAAPGAPMAFQRSAIAVEGFAPAGLADAIALLGGSLRLVDGLVPDRLEASATTVRVIYPLREGELVLEQRREGDSLRVSLRGPLSRDSLAVLRGRVR